MVSFSTVIIPFTRYQWHFCIITLIIWRLLGVFIPHIMSRIHFSGGFTPVTPFFSRDPHSFWPPLKNRRLRRAFMNNKISIYFDSGQIRNVRDFLRPAQAGRSSMFPDPSRRIVKNPEHFEFDHYQKYVNWIWFGYSN